MTLTTALLSELETEAAVTRRLLERVPEAHFTWKPHEKSSSLGQLALHVASLPQQLTEFVVGDRLDVATVDFRQPTPRSHAELMAAFDAGLKTASSFLATLDDLRAAGMWRLVAQGTDLLAAPRAAVIRTFMFNHLYHHRGQLLVYLRLLDVPVPSVYGPTADENPFAAAVQAV
ncbi:MAG TPA: DinB family protein [Vicinamibacterales bacterium]|nr:DinB family protein [Vicinamibacterales bacterium]